MGSLGRRWSVVTYIHSGAHQLPDDVPPVIVKFFKQHAGRS